MYKRGVLSCVHLRSRWLPPAFLHAHTGFASTGGCVLNEHIWCTFPSQPGQMPHSHQLKCCLESHVLLGRILVLD